LRGRKSVVIIGAGLVGAHYTKLLLSEGYDVFATVLDIERESDFFVQRVFGDGKDLFGNSLELTSHEQGVMEYTIGDRKARLTSYDVLNENLGSLLARLVPGSSRGIDHVVNSINLGTIFGMRALHGELGHTDIFDFSYQYNEDIQHAALQQGKPIPHLFVSTTGSGGIGLERMRISHNRDGTGIPPSIILKRQKAQELLACFVDFKATNNGSVKHHAIVPASAIIDLEIYDSDIEAYGDYKQHGPRLKAYHPEVRINGVIRSSLRELGLLQARYGLFGEDGPHTVADLQQLQMFMGVTTATKIAQIARDTITGRGPYDYNVLNGGHQIPEQSEYAVLSFEKKFRRGDNGRYNPVTLSPIAPFEISLYSFAYELLSEAGLESLDDIRSAEINDDAIKSLAGRMQKVLDDKPEMLIAGTSLGVAYDLQGDDKYQAEGNFVRGTLDNQLIIDAILSAKEFIRFRRISPKLDDFLTAYDSSSGIATKDVIGYLAAYPVAEHMRKGGHF